MNDSARETKTNWWQRLSGGLKRTSSALGGAIADLVAKRKLDAILASHYPTHISDSVDEAIRARLPIRLDREAMRPKAE